MKRITALLLFAAVALPAFAQDLGEFTFNGFVRTGFIWKKDEKFQRPSETEVKLGNLDDAGSGQGRIRMDFGYTNQNAGLKGRIQWDNWTADPPAPQWPYLFAYINAFEDQLTLSAGKLGASPWGTGGPEEWKELESVDKGGGMRIEYKPAFVPGLNAGLVLNWYNGSLDRGIGRDVTLLDILQETVIGVAYENDNFLARFEYRLDSEIDQRPGSFASGREGDDLVYRLEEKVLRQKTEGLKIWALGVYEGVGAEFKECIYLKNWIFAEYAPGWGTAQVRLGYKVVETRSLVSIKPSYYHNLFDNLISVGASFMYENDFGDRNNKDAPYTEIQLEPKLQLNFTNAYVAFTYNFKQNYKKPENGVALPLERYQTMNLRFGLTF